MDEFVNLWNVHHAGLHCFVLADQLGCHKEPQIVKKLAEKDVYTVLFPPNTSHFIQPLDGHVFRTLKRFFTLALDQHLLDAAVEGDDPGSAVFYALFDAALEAFKPEIIQASFSSRGIWPFDRLKVVDALDSWLGIKLRSSSDQLLSDKLSIVNMLVEQSNAISSQRLKATEARFTRRTMQAPLNSPKTWQQIAAEDERRKRQAAEEAATKEAAAREREERKQQNLLAEQARQAQVQANKDERERKRIQQEISKECRGRCGKIKFGHGWTVCACKMHTICRDCYKNSRKNRSFTSHFRVCKGPPLL
jgi:hypothetical protein